MEERCASGSSDKMKEINRNVLRLRRPPPLRHFSGLPLLVAEGGARADFRLFRAPRSLMFLRDLREEREEYVKTMRDQ